MGIDSQEITSPVLEGVFRKIREKGWEEGREEGVKQTRERFARELILDDFDDEKIARLTKLSLQEIARLRDIC